LRPPPLLLARLREAERDEVLAGPLLELMLAEEGAGALRLLHAPVVVDEQGRPVLALVGGDRDLADELQALAVDAVLGRDLHRALLGAEVVGAALAVVPELEARRVERLAGQRAVAVRVARDVEHEDA